MTTASPTNVQFSAENTTLEACLLAVHRCGSALMGVGKNMQLAHPEICLTAVRQDGLALFWVHAQTPEICLAAVCQNGHALEFVSPEHRTFEICLAAARQNSRASLHFVDRGGCWERNKGLLLVAAVAGTLGYGLSKIRR